MKIKIYKDESKTLFSYDGNSFEFNYDNINTFITERLKNLSESIEFETDEDLNDYQELLTKGFIFFIFNPIHNIICIISF